MNSIEHKKVLSRFSVLISGRLAGAIATFTASLLIARYLGADTLGQFSILLAITSVMSVFASGGYPAIATIFAAQYTAKSQPGLLKGFTISASRQILAGAGLSVVAVLSYSLIMPDSVNMQAASMAGLVGITVLFIAATNFFGAVLTGLNRQMAGLLPDTLLKPIVFLAIVSGAIVLNFPVHAAGILACFAMASLVAATYAGYNVFRSSFMLHEVSVDRTQGAWCKTAYPWIVTTLVWDFFIELHIILAGWIAAPAEVAVLHVAFRFRMLAGFGMRSLYALFLPGIVEANARQDNHQVRLKLRTVNNLAFVYSLMVMGFFAIAGSSLLQLFGQEFIAGWLPLVIVSSTMCVRAVFGPAPAILAMNEHQNPSAIVMSGCLILSLTMALFLYPSYGLAGIATSYAVANLVGSVALWIWARGLTGIDTSLFATGGQTEKVIN